MIKKIALTVLMTVSLMNLAACSPYVTWEEEVKLNDGRIIVVEQKKRTEGPIDREAWFKINLPEISAQPIVWHENLAPLVVNFHEGHLYVVGYPPTPFEARKYGCPKPGYMGFVWESGKWMNVAFEKIPKEIYPVNMIIGLPPEGISLLTLEKKNSAELNGAPTLLYQRKIDPNRGSGC